MKLSDLKILVTGGSGFVGSAFVDFLKKKGISYILYDRRHPELFTSGFNSVVHIGGLTPQSKLVSEKDIREAFFDANVEGTKKLLHSIAKNPNLLRFVNIGSFAEYGFSGSSLTENTEEKAKGAYGESKCEQSALVKDFAYKRGIKTVNLRISNMVGPSKINMLVPRMMRPSIFQNLEYQFSRQPDEALVLEVSNGGDMRDYVDSDDVMQAILSALLTDKGELYEIVNICSGRGVSIADIAFLYGKHFHKAYSLKNTSAEITVSIGNAGKARKFLGWSPQFSLEKSLKKIL